MQDVITACRKLAKPASARDITVAAETLVTVEETITRARQKVKGLLGFEMNAKPALEIRIKDLEREQDRLRRLKDFGHLPCLSFEPLRWRGKDGWPRLAILSLESPRFQLGIVGNYTTWGDGRLNYKVETTPNLPPSIKDCYSDVLATLRVMAKKKRTSVRLATEYSGVIPDSVHEKIEKAKSGFKEIFIIAEAKGWVVSETKIPRPKPSPGDPLVVGFDGANLWVIDTFDLTPVERYIKAEFAV